MKSYKKLLFTSLAAFALVAMPSCDYLDIDPEDSVPEEDVDFSKIENMYQPVSGTYAKLRTGGMHWVISMLSVIRDGDVWSGRVDDQADLVNMGNHYQYNNAWWGLNEMWNQYYGMIKVANAALESLDSYAEHITTDADRATYRSYCGEVRILRAYAYYRLCQYFGDVTILDSNTQTDMTRSVRDVVYEYVLRDLDYAIANCPKLLPSEMPHVGAFTAYTAYAIAARIYLNMGNYAKVEEMTNAIINSGKFELYPDYYQLFKIPGKLCSESLAECQATDFGVGTGDIVGVDQFFNCAGPSISNPNTVLQSTGGWTFIGYFDSFYNWAIERGETVRATTSFLVGGTTTPSGDYVAPVGNPSNTNCWNGKWYLPLDQMTEGRTTYGTNNNVRIFRYSDVLLMNAEAKVRQGRNGDEPFNKVRTRAQMPTLTGVTVDQILDERRMELCCEWGARYEDLLRTGLAASVLGPSGWTQEKAYYPVPYAQYDQSPQLRDEPYTTLNF